MPYRQGQLVVARGAFRDSSGNPVDPSIVKITVVRPDGLRNEYTYGTDAALVKDSIGNYHLNVNGDIPGTYVYWWHSGGTGKAADEKTFQIQAALSADPPGEPGTLDISYLQILREVGRLLGLHRDHNTWEPDQRQDVADIIRSGLRRFYWPPVLPTAEGRSVQSYSWSFLRAASTITLGANESLYALPDDFGEMLGGVFTQAAGSKRQPIAIIGEEQLRQLQANSSATGTPKYAAIRQVAGTPMRYEAIFYPTPGTADSPAASPIVLSYEYAVAPPELSETHPYPYGGAQHSEAILEAILAAAEKTLFDEPGIHESRFLECLARSIAADQNLNQQTEEGPWPLEAVDDLNITKGYLKKLIGRHLGFGPHSGTWGHRQTEEVNEVLRSGLRKFYSPMVLPGERFPHEWSFLCPLHYFTTAEDVSRYDLPDDFALFDGPILHAPTAAALYPPIQIVGESQLRYLQQASLGSGRPTMAAIRPKPTDPAGFTRWELLLHKTPDGEYPLSFRYQVNPALMPEDACLPYGGQPHAQTIIEACLCAAEEHAVTPTKGPVHGQRFLECLIRSVGHDRKASTPDTLGRNIDPGDLPVDRNWHEINEVVHAFNGVFY